MVNPGKRMRKLQPLLSIRMGPGAALLPPHPAPQLTKVHLKYSATKGYGAATYFWRNHLQRLKFYNPALQVIVERYKGYSATLKLHFEGDDVEALRQIPGDVRDRRASTEQEPAESPTEDTIPSITQAVHADQHISKAQETADPSSPSSTDPPKAAHFRTVTMGLRRHTIEEIWEWFQDRTKCQPVPEDPKDIGARQALDELLAIAELDRQRVKKGMDEMKAEKETLRKAKAEAEKAKAEVA